jgi:hypothetical protein
MTPSVAPMVYSSKSFILRNILSSLWEISSTRCPTCYEEHRQSYGQSACIVTFASVRYHTSRRGDNRCECLRAAAPSARSAAGRFLLRMSVLSSDRRSFAVGLCFGLSINTQESGNVC